MTGDATDRKVRRLLREGRPMYRDPSGYYPDLWCRCLHHSDAHGGPGGDGPCTEHGCGCTGFEVADIECPDCFTQWSLALPACPNCGLNKAEIAQHAADADAPR
jgi:hypothetical protein